MVLLTLGHSSIFLTIFPLLFVSDSRVDKWVHRPREPTFRKTDFSFFLMSQAPAGGRRTVVGGARVVIGAEKKII